jgi:hypothetical protein
MSQEVAKSLRGPVTPRTVGGRVLLAPPAAAAQAGYSLPHFNRLLREGKLKLTKHYLYAGGLPRYAEDEIEALKA